MEFRAQQQGEAALNVQQFLDQRNMVREQWLILLLCFFVLVTDGFHTAAIAFVAPALIADLSISREALGPLLAAALVGLAIGALVSGPLADRFGRKRVLIGSVLICGAGSLISSSASGLAFLIACRFVTGLGIGAAMPNCTTLASEFVPLKRRAVLLNLMFCGFPLGASTGGFLAAWLVPHFGWRSVFIVGGAAPLVLTAFMTRMPESISFMVVRHYSAEKVRSALLKIAGRDSVALSRIAAASSFTITGVDDHLESSPLKVMFGPRFIVPTLMLWLAYFMGLLLFYMVTSWMPTLLRDAGYSVAQASIATALFPLGGGFGAAFCGWLMGRMNSTRIVSCAYFLTAIGMLMLSHSTRNFNSLICVTFLAGLAMNGAQTSMPALAAASYPTYGRASGVSWMLGMGRIGGILGAFGGAVLLRAGWSLVQIIAGLSIAAFVAGLALLIKDYATREMPNSPAGQSNEAGPAKGAS